MMKLSSKEAGAAILLLLSIANQGRVAVVAEFPSYAVPCPNKDANGNDVIGYQSTGDIMRETMDYLATLQEARTAPTWMDFVLCPNTIFEIDAVEADETLPQMLLTDRNPPIYILMGSTFKCGSDGSSKNNCVFSGGDTQVLSMFDTVGTRLEGITFKNVGATRVNVFAGGPESSSVDFVDCHFEGNKGDAVIYIQRLEDEAEEETQEEAADEAAAAAEGEAAGGGGGGGERKLTRVNMPWSDNLRRLEEVAPGMTVNFEGCSFEDNTNEQGFAMANLNGVLSITDTTFNRNTYSSIIGTGAGGTTVVDKSCFESNKVYWPGVALVEVDSTHTSSNCYVEENDSFKCPYLFRETEAHAECQIEADKCIGECVDSDESKCMATNAKYSPPEVTEAPTEQAPAGGDAGSVAVSVNSSAGMYFMSKFVVMAGCAMFGWMMALA